MNKVLFLTHVGDPGGAEFTMMNFFNNSAFSNSEVVLFQPGSLLELLSKRGILGRVVKMPESLVNFKRSDGLTKAITKTGPALYFMRELVKTTRNYQSLICMSQKSFFLVAIAKPFIRRPVIWFMNDLVSEQHFNKKLIKLMVLISRFSADHVVLNSTASYRAWLEAGGREAKTSVIYPGTEFALFENTADCQDQIANFRSKYSNGQPVLVGMFGRITSWKGQDVFIKAIAETENCSGVIVGKAFFGEEHYEQSLHALVKQLKLEHRVFFAGHVDDIPVAMTACDIVVHCSRSPEPFGMVIVEALAANKPVIASNAGGAREIIEHENTGLLTPIDDPPALAAAIKRYIASPEWASKVAESGHKNAQQKFSTSAMIKQLLNVLEAVNVKVKG